MSLSNPLNIILIPPILYLVYLIILPSPPISPSSLPTEYDPDVYNWMPGKHPTVLLHTEFSVKELSAFDGKDGGRICLAIMRVGRDGKVGKEKERTVFDVSMGRGFYGPGEYEAIHRPKRV